MSRWFAVLLVLTGCFSYPAWAAEDSELLVIGFYLPGIRDANQADLKISLGVWAEELGKAESMQAKSVLYDDMQLLQQDALAQRVNMVVAPGMEMAENFKPDDFAEGFAGQQRDTEQGLALIVAKTSAIHRFADLRGKQVLRQSNDRLLDKYLEIQCLKQAATACRDFLTVTEVRHDASAIYKVFFGKADAALVSLSALHAAMELNPQMAVRLLVLQDWRTRAMAYAMMTRFSAPDFRQRVIRSAIKLIKTTRGNQIMQIFKTDYLDQVSSQDLQPYWQLDREYQQLVRNKTGAR